MDNKLNQNNNNWLPDFSDPVRIFTVIAVAEIMVIVYSLSFLSFDWDYLNQLAILSLLAQIIAINLIVVLYKLRPSFNQLGVKLGILLVLLFTVLLSAVLTELILWLDTSLFIGLIDNSQLSTIKISIATSIGLLTLLRYFYVQNQWEKQVEALAKAQMNALQARIKPHFLYNSLNSIASLIAFDQKSAEKAVLNLSSLFRKAFSDHKKSMTIIADELEWIGEYLAIEKLRLADRLQYRQTVDDELLDKKIPLLSIQPLVENAVIHGIQHLSDGGLIELKVQAKEEGFFVEIKNPTTLKKEPSGTKTGLDNIRQRLLITYGEKVSMDVIPGDPFTVRWEVKA